MKRLITLLAVALTGCVHGAWFEPEDVKNDIKPGITSYTDAVAVLGKPSKVERDGATKTARWTGFVSGPFYFGPFRELVLQFDESGKVVKVVKMEVKD